MRALPQRIADRKFNRKDVEEWENRLPLMLAHATTQKAERELRAAIMEAKSFLDLRLPFVGGGAAVFGPADELDLDNEDQYAAIVGGLISLTRDANERAQVLASWRGAEKKFKDEIAKGTDPRDLPEFKARLPGVGDLVIQYVEGAPLKKTVRLAFDSAIMAKRARSMLKKDFQYDAG